MKLWLPVLTAAAASVQAFWGNGHMLVGEVAAQALSPDDLVTLNALLQSEGYEEQFPNTGTVTTATIWPDLLKCKQQASFCMSEKIPSISMFDNWHYTNLPLNVNGSDYKGLTSKDTDALFSTSFDGSSLDMMVKAVTTFKTTRSAHAANFVLRMFLHIFSDTANPFHAVAGVTDYFPNGDQGGNFFQFTNCFPNNNPGNLHALWDSVGTKYSTVDWAPNFTPGTTDYNALVTNATKIATKYADAPDPLNVVSLKDLNYSSFASKAKSLFEQTIMESYDIARNVGYKGLDFTCSNAQPSDGSSRSCKISCPSSDYIAKLVDQVERNIAIWGKRMAIILTQMARQTRAQGLVATTPTTPTPSTPAPTTPCVTDTYAPTTSPPADETPLQLCTISKFILSEYYDHLYVDIPRGNDNEIFLYDFASQTLRSKTDGKYLDASNDTLMLERGSGAITQKWILENMQVKSLFSGKVLTFDHSKPGSSPYLTSPTGKVSQYFDYCDRVRTSGMLVKLRTQTNRFVSEFHSNLYADNEVDNFNELFEFDGRLFKSISAYNQCLDAYDSGYGQYKLHAFECSAENKNQQWNVDASDHRVKHAVHQNLCLDVDPTYANKGVQVWKCHSHLWNMNQWIDVVKY